MNPAPPFQWFRRAALLFFLTVLIPSCGDTTGPPTPDTIRISPSAAILTAVGGQQQFSATVLDKKSKVISDAAVVWSVSDIAVASIDQNGLLEAKANGQVTVTALSGGAKGIGSVTVSQEPAEVRIISSPDTLTAIGDTLRIAVEMRDENGNMVTEANLSWSSDDSSVLTVEASSGVVEAVGAGMASIRVSYGADLADELSLWVIQTPTALVLSSRADTLDALGATVDLNALLLDRNGFELLGALISWNSEEEAIATVDGNGRITARANGETTIAASSADLEDFASITVAQRPVLLRPESSQYQVAEPGGVLAENPTLLILDRLENPVPGVEVVFEVLEGDGAVSHSWAVSDANGIASSGSWALGVLPGHQILRASAPAFDLEFHFRAAAIQEAVTLSVPGDSIVSFGMVFADSAVVEVTAPVLLVRDGTAFFHYPALREAPDPSLDQTGRHLAAWMIDRWLPDPSILSETQSRATVPPSEVVPHGSHAGVSVVQIGPATFEFTNDVVRGALVRIRREGEEKHYARQYLAPRGPLVNIDPVRAALQQGDFITGLERQSFSTSLGGRGQVEVFGSVFSAFYTPMSAMLELMGFFRPTVREAIEADPLGFFAVNSIDAVLHGIDLFQALLGLLPGQCIDAFIGNTVAGGGRLAFLNLLPEDLRAEDVQAAGGYLAGSVIEAGGHCVLDALGIGIVLDAKSWINAVAVAVATLERAWHTFHEDAFKRLEIEGDPGAVWLRAEPEEFRAVRPPNTSGTLTGYVEVLAEGPGEVRNLQCEVDYPSLLNKGWLSCELIDDATPTFLSLRFDVPGDFFIELNRRATVRVSGDSPIGVQEVSINVVEETPWCMARPETCGTILLDFNGLPSPLEPEVVIERHGVQLDWIPFRKGVPIISGTYEIHSKTVYAGVRRFPALVARRAVEILSWQHTEVQLEHYENLIGHYPLEGALLSYASDASTNNRNGFGSANKGPDRWGEPGGAAQFDGSGKSGFFIPHEFNRDGHQITVAAWLRTSADDLRVAVAKGDGFPFTLGVRNGRFNFGLGNVLGARLELETETRVDGAWHFVVGTYDQREAKIYVDGQLENGASFPGPLFENTLDIGIGRPTTTEERAWLGLIDDVVIIGQAISEQDVVRLMGTWMPPRLQIGVHPTHGLTIAPGGSLTFSIVVTDGSQALADARIEVHHDLDPKPSVVYTDTYGQASFTVTAPGVLAPGVFQISFQASHSSFQPSDVVTAQFEYVTPASPTVSIHSVTKGGTAEPVDLDNVFGQIDVTLNINPNDQTVTQVDVLVDGAVAASQVLSGVPHQQHFYGNPEANNPQVVTLSVNTARYEIDPGTSTASARFGNGPRIIGAQVHVQEASLPTLANTIDVVFYNENTFHVLVSRAGLNTALDVSQLLWYGGPGFSLVVYPIPVMYNGQVVVSMTSSLRNETGDGLVAGDGLGNCGVQTDNASPFSFTWTCTNREATGFLPVVTATVTDAGENGPVSGFGAALNIANVANMADHPFPVRIDVRAPQGGSIRIIRQSGILNVGNWVNDLYSFTQAGAYTAATDGGVGGVTRVRTEVIDLLAGNTVVWSSATGVNNLVETVTNTQYRVRTVAQDALGNAAAISQSSNSPDHPLTTFGFDVTRPSVSFSNHSSEVGNLTQRFNILERLVAGDNLRATVTDSRSGLESTTGVSHALIWVLGAFQGDGAIERGRIVSAAGSPAIVGTPFATAAAGNRVVAPALVTAPNVDYVSQHTARLAIDNLGSVIAGALWASVAPARYYVYQLEARDQAGNVARDYRAVYVNNNSQPVIQNLSNPANLTAAAAFSAALAQDSVEVLQGSLELRYPNAGGAIVWERPTADIVSLFRMNAEMPDGLVFSDIIHRPSRDVGFPLAFHALGLPFLRSVQTLDSHSVVTAKPDSVRVRVFNGFGTENDLLNHSSVPLTGGSGFSASSSNSIQPSEVANPATLYHTLPITSYQIVRTGDAGVVDCPAQYCVRAIGPRSSFTNPFGGGAVLVAWAQSNQFGIGTGANGELQWRVAEIAAPNFSHPSPTREYGDYRVFEWTFSLPSGVPIADRSLAAIGIHASSGDGLLATRQ